MLNNNQNDNDYGLNKKLPLSPTGQRTQIRNNNKSKLVFKRSPKSTNTSHAKYDLSKSGRRGQNLVKQRGIYSELLGKPNERFIQKVTKGPNDNITSMHLKQLPTQTKSVYSNNDIIKSDNISNQNDVKPYLEPKVSAPYIPRRGEPPRKIVVERKKRLYEQQNIEELLKQRNIDYQTYTISMDHLTGNKTYLQLNLFDDTDYESRNCEDWIDYNNIVKAKALRINKDGYGQYQPCQVLLYDKSTNKFEIKWDDTHQKHHLDRIYINFQAEDPFVYADRVERAHQLRREAEATIRYALYIDSMPSDDITGLDVETINRVMTLALSQSHINDTLDTTPLLNEVNLDYQRVMNKLTFDSISDKKVIETIQSQFPPNFLNFLLQQASKYRINDNGMISIPKYNFLQKFNDFCFNSFLTKSEAIDAISFVNNECIKVRKLDVFSPKLVENRAMRLDDFEQLQLAALSTLSHFLKDTWNDTLADGVSKCLNSVGKGWFNQSQNQEIYLFSKLKKLMILSKFMMEAAVRDLIDESLEKYTQKIENACSFSWKIKSCNHVNLFPYNNSNKSNDKNISSVLYLVSLSVEDGKIQYRSSINNLANIPLHIFDKCMETIQGIPQLEVKIMPQLFRYGNEENLLVPQRHQKWIQNKYDRIESALQKSLKILNDYIMQYDKFTDFMELDVDHYVSNYFTTTPSIEDFYKEIHDRKAIIRDLATSIPNQINLGVAIVESESVRKHLIRKHSQIVQKQLDSFANRTRMNCTQIGNIFRQIEKEIRTQPSNISELTELQTYIKSVPSKLDEQKPAIDEVMKSYELLDTFRYRYPKELYRLQWVTFGWPKVITDLIEMTTSILLKDTDRFLKDMETEQEEFNHEIIDIASRIDSFGEYADVELLKQVHRKAIDIDTKLQELMERANHFNSNEVLFKRPMTDYRRISQLKKKFEPFYLMWTTIYEWSRKSSAWKTNNFFTLNAEEVQNVTAISYKSISKVINSSIIQEHPALCAIAVKIKEQVEEFKPIVPLVTSLRNPGMSERHWTKLSSELGIPLNPQRKLNLTEMLSDLNIMTHMDTISKLADIASKEYQIEQALDKMEQEWHGVDFEITEYKDTGSYVVHKADIIMSMLDEHIVMTQSMQFSPYRKEFQERINDWDKKLRTASEVIEEWLAVQRQWLSLQPIFASPDINRQLPAEGKRFAHVNKTWRFIMSQVYTNPDALNFADNQSLLHKFQEANRQLEEIQKKLSDYLDQKRSIFARFYFLSNDELLNILSQSRNPTAVQPHLKKCFENISTLEFIDQGTQIKSMMSSMNEKVQFSNIISTEDKGVEYWMGDVENEMKESIKNTMNDAIIDYNKCPRTEWVRKWPAQCVLNASQLHWTQDVENVLRNEGYNGIVKYTEKWKNQLLSMVELVRSPLSDIEELTMNSLIVLDVHARDVLERLVNEKVTNPSDFAWICQMRYYLNDDNNLLVRMVQASFLYGYEYLGNTSRLVITPLTDRCYMTLMGAMQLHLGGAPAGPAGTGKTETVKDLAKAVAKQCVVFNCSDGLDYLAMGKFFKGLATSGAWACFDEFNRIDIEVLSVVAQQIMTIWGAVKEGVNDFIFEGSNIKLDRSCSVYITMNPGYAGRTELPDNLKALFRPVAMMVPNYALIAEILLYSYGFNNAKALARKMVATFRLSSEQLSAQDHYDYGMRAVKTTIIRAGILKRENPNALEDALTLQALRDVNVPKFLSNDLPLFEGIIADLFPGVEHPETNTGMLEKCLIQTALDLGLQPVPSFIDKCLQLYSTSIVRHGLMVVGPTGGGKSCMINTVMKASTKLSETKVESFKPILSHPMNPKAVTMGQLYGEFDENTHEWTDGILANIVRNCVNDFDVTKIENSIFNRHWVIFDGPVDAIWIENMNTVLDDNKKLCLVSGEMLQLTSEMNMIFEVEDLAVASPATVSRCGMVYVEPSDLGTNALLQSWLNSLPISFNNIKSKLVQLFEQYIESTLKYLRKYCKEIVPTVNSNLIQSMLNILESLLLENTNLIFVNKNDELNNDNDDEKNNEFEKQVNYRIDSLFIVSMIWSFGASTNKIGREDFNRFLRMKMLEFDYSQFPEIGSVYDYFFDIQSCTWINWMKHPSKTLSLQENSSNELVSEIIVPTIDSIRYIYLLNLLAMRNKHVLFTGQTGTGKTVNVQHWLNATPEHIMPLNIMFSAATSANQTEKMIANNLEKRRKGVYGPPVGKRCIIFVDDMNMPAREKYFAQPPIELLRQWMDYGGWYDRKTLQFNQIIDLTMIGAMGPPGGGRNPVTPRFLRHFNHIAHTELEEESLTLIFSTILKQGLVNFTDDIRNVTSNTVKATVQVYKTICSELLPTPEKSHYTFNLRDLSKVFQGLLYSSPQHVTNIDQFLCLWVHETRRVFQDRLVDDHDREWLDGLLSMVVKEHYQKSFMDIIPDRLIFGDFVGSSGHGSDRREYQAVTDFGRLKEVVQDYLNAYADEYSPLNLVMFQDAISHVSRIARILREPKGNALLLGVGGSGRQSLTKLAAYINEYNLVQIELSKAYGMSEWRDNIKDMLMRAGLSEEPTVFLFVDTQIIYEKFLEDVNSILNSGDVPGLYTNDDMEKIQLSCKLDCQRRGIIPTPANVYQQYISRVRRNMHIVLCMSPLSNDFRTRLRMFPSLVNCCTIDWFSPWPSDALSTVANDALQSENMDTHKDSCVKLFEIIHLSVEEMSEVYRNELSRHNYVTPTSFLQLLSLFKNLLKDQHELLGGKRSKLQNGLNTLEHAAIQVRQLQLDLKAKQPILEQTQKDVEKMMIEIAEDSKDAETTKEIVEKQEAEAAANAAECTEIRDSAQSDLDKALPLLEEAVECLKELKKADLDEVRAMKKPPYGVILTLEAACIMLQKRPVMKNDPEQVGKKIADYWETAQKELLRDPRLLLQTLQEYDKDNIPDTVIRKIAPYIERDDFQISAVQKASKACTAVALWVHAMFKYYHVLIEVEPKRERLRLAEDKLAVVIKALNEAKDKLNKVMEKIRILTENHEKALQQQENLKNEILLCEIKLERANKLIGGLGGEKQRWMETIKTLDINIGNLIGDVLIAAGTIAYLGAFSSSYRDKLTHMWRSKLKELNVPHTDDIDICKLLADPVRIREWNIAGLPSDQNSIENGVIMSKAERWPLMIDPQGQANKFIRSLGDSRFKEGMDVIKLHDKSFVRTIENAIRFGKWVLIENIHEELDPLLEPLLLKQFTYTHQQPHIKLGDNMLPYNDQFRLFFTTRLSNPHYSPELQVKVTLLNFTITPDGLQEQMIGVVVAKENPELEQKKSTLVVQNASMKKELQAIEDQILKLLSQTTADPLEDEELISTLAYSKKTALQITERVAESVQVEEKIDLSRSAYTIVAQRASILYFTIADLAIVDPMYQYSLQWFVELFVQSIVRAPTSTQLNERLESLNNYFTYELYCAICRSLFEEHKTLFSLLLTIRILQGNKQINEQEWRFLVSEASINDDDKRPNPASHWLNNSSWITLLALSHLSNFKGLSNDFFEPDKLTMFQNYYESLTPYNETLPSPWEDSLNDFQKLLILKCLRPDKMTLAIKEFVSQKIGNKFTESPAFSINHSFSVSTRTSPLVFILSRGADPAAELLTFANDMGFREKLVSISLGQGQGMIAQRHLEKAMINGGWVLLQNCHLAASWLPQLEKICEDMKLDDVHPDFRLWLTSRPTKDFPVSILQNGVKMTNEPPQGLRANMLRSYMNFNEDWFNSCKNSKAFKKLLFGLCFFHAVVLDRRKFGALGWNIQYEFTENDLQVCITQLREFVDMYDEIPYDVIRFLTGEINYGGRVTDDSDRHTIKTILQDYINPNIMKDSYHFNEKSRYKSIPATSLDDYISYIKSMDSVPEPSVFGLHENADITSAHEQTLKMFSTILRMLPRSIGSGSKDANANIIATAQMIIEKVPSPFDIDLMREKYPTEYKESMNTVLVQEAIRYNRLLKCVHTTVLDILKALRGEMVMTSNLEEMADSLQRNEIPKEWTLVGYPSLMPLSSWVNNLVKRVKFIQSWYNNGMPTIVWMSGLFFPQAFLTGTLQNYARKYRVPIDSVSFDYQIIDKSIDDINQPPDDGVYIHGLQLEGACWDPIKKSLVDSAPRELFTSFPVIWLRPSTNREEIVNSNQVYRCPVYKTLSRAGTLSTTGHSTNFVLHVDIPTKDPPSKWTKCGVSLFCALRY